MLSQNSPRRDAGDGLSRVVQDSWNAWQLKQPEKAATLLGSSLRWTVIPEPDFENIDVFRTEAPCILTTVEIGRIMSAEEPNMCQISELKTFGLGAHGPFSSRKLKA